MAQHIPFPSGGYVVHKMLAPRRISAWFDAAGALLDAEQIDRLGRSRPVKRGGALWDEIERAGSVYARRLA